MAEVHLCPNELQGQGKAERQAHKLDSSLLVPRGQYLLVFSIMRRTDRVDRIDFIQSRERR